MTTKVGSTTNGRSHMTTSTSKAMHYLIPLGNLDGERMFAYSLWHYPADQDFYAVDKGALEEYLQTAGSADRLTVEIREAERQGGYAQYVLATAPITGAADQTIEWSNHTTQVHREEVFTADQAKELFKAYYETGTVPASVPRRRLHLG